MLVVVILWFNDVSEQKNLASPQNLSTLWKLLSCVGAFKWWEVGEHINATLALGIRKATHSLLERPPLAHPAFWLQKSEFPFRGQAGDSPKHRKSSCLIILLRIPYLLIRLVSDHASKAWITVWGKSIVMVIRKNPSVSFVVLVDI